MLTAAECHLTFNSSTLVVARTLGHGCAVSVCWVCTCVTIAMAGWLHGVCVSRRKQHRPGIAPNANTTHVPTAGSSAAPTKPNHTPSRHSRANYSYQRSHPTPLEAFLCSHVHKNAPARTQSPGGRPPSTCNTELHNPPRLRTQRQSGLPPRAASSQGQWH